MADVIIRGRVLTGEGEDLRQIKVNDGMIVAIEPLTFPAQPDAIELADDEVLLPGLVDTHVHVNEPRRTEWEGFATATAAAAAGGVTTILDMPLNWPGLLGRRSPAHRSSARRYSPR